MMDSELSRIEQIANGTYTGPYLSRMEALMSRVSTGSGGSGGTSPSPGGDDDDYEAIPLDDLKQLFEG